MKEHYKKLNGLINLKPRSNETKNKRLEVMIHAGNIYNKLYNIYRSKYYKKIDSLSAKDKKKALLVIIGARLMKNNKNKKSKKNKKNKIKNYLI